MLDTVDVLLDAYFREHVAIKNVARERTEYAIRPLKEFFNGTPLYHVDIPLCRRYRNEHRAYVSDSTVRRELGVLQAAANHALRWRHISADQMPSIELPAEPAPKTLWLTKSELLALGEAAEKVSERCSRFVVLAYYTAGRKASIESLEWSQIDLLGNRINLQGARDPLTKKRRPIVAVPLEIQERMKQWSSTPSGPFVIGGSGDIRYEFDKAAALASLAELSRSGLRQPGRTTPHLLRHSRATHLLQDGKKPYAVANLLGDTIQTLLRVYGHACPDYMSELLA